MKPSSGHQSAIRAKHRYGQNFLQDKNILRKIVASADIRRDTFVIEIGPGRGALTAFLLDAANKVLAYEIDRDLIPLLADKFKDARNLILVNEDVLEADIEADIDKYFPQDAEIVMVSNLPYYVTTPILQKFLEETRRLRRLVVMTQLEVARRLTSPPGTKDYNALSIAIAYRAVAKFLFKVPRTVFRPSPQVDSAVVSLELVPGGRFYPKDERTFFQVVRGAFAQRRKTLANNLLATFPDFDRAGIETLLNQVGLPLQTRAEAVKIESFVALADAIHEQHV